MYNILIVEDEEIIRNVLPQIIDWEKLGFSVAGAVENSMEALRLLSNISVDVVLTDIRMPGINGLELACEIKARYPDIKTVLLSAYNDFEYARKGIEYGVYGYLLKSEDEEVFEEYFIKMKIKLDKERQVKKEGLTVIDAPEESLFNKRNKLMHNLLSNKSNQASDELFEQIKDCRIPLGCNNCFLLILCIDNYKTLRTSLGANTLSKTYYSFLQKLYELIECEDKGYVIPYDSYFNVLLESSEISLKQNVEKIVMEIADELDLYANGLDISLSCAVGKMVLNVNDFAENYHHTLNLLKRKVYLGRGKIIYSEDNEFNVTVDNNHVNSIMARIYSDINKDDFQKIKEELANLKEYLISARLSDEDYAVLLGIDIIMHLYEHSKSRNNNSCNLLRIQDYIRELGDSETLFDLCEKLQEFLFEYEKIMGCYDHNHLRKITEKALKYIRSNYSSDINLGNVASYVNVHPVHLCRLLNTEVGKSFKDILTETRIEAAKSLLSDIDIKVYEIAELIGYKKPRYFSELFKKYTGVTPLEYRESYSK